MPAAAVEVLSPVLVALKSKKQQQVVAEAVIPAVLVALQKMMLSMKKITVKAAEVVNQRVQVALPMTLMIKKKTMARAAEVEQNKRAVCT